jgi:hypothetical protein
VVSIKKVVQITTVASSKRPAFNLVIGARKSEHPFDVVERCNGKPVMTQSQTEKPCFQMLERSSEMTLF